MLALILAAEFVNGWTDAPDAIATVVSTRVLSGGEPRNSAVSRYQAVIMARDKAREKSILWLAQDRLEAY